MKKLEDLLIELDEIVGISGDEEKVGEYISNELSGSVDHQYTDALGNHIYVKEGTNPDVSIMLAAHMDEVGFIVTHIDEKGFVYFGPVGGHDSRMVVSQILEIQTEKGPVKGVTGNKPGHIVSAEEAKKAIPMDKLFLDIGTNSKEETKELGVQVGDLISFDRKGQYLNGSGFFTGKAVDDRAGCAVLVEVMKRIAKKNITPTVYGVATVQEELGVRGAGPAAFGIEPTVALSIDVTLSGGTPGIDEKELLVHLGQGAAITFYDGGLAVPRKLSKKLVDVAEKNNIPYQRDILFNGATDGKAISLSGKGVVTGTVSIPSRYIHSSVGCVHLDDVEHCVQLIVKFIEEYSGN